METQSDLTKTRLEKLKSKLKTASLKTENDRQKFLLELNPIIQQWKTGTGRGEKWNDVPNLGDVFEAGEIELLLESCINLITEDKKHYLQVINFIKLVPASGYRDKHDDVVDEDGKPVLLRDTLLHRLAKHDFYERNAVAAEFFKIYDRFDRNYIGTYVTHFDVACMTGCLEAVEKFIEFGQDVSDSKWLFLAAKYNHRRVIRLLVEHGADPNSTRLGTTPLHVTCEREEDKDSITAAATLIRVAKEKGKPVQVDARDHLNRTPLNVAATWRNHSCVVTLLHAGADPNSIDYLGNTPLHRICMSSTRPQFGVDESLNLVRRFFEIAEELNRTVLLNVKNNAGRTPLDMAYSFKNERIIEFLTDKGAKRSTPPPSNE
ncbi:hypothetical protein TKK_0005406 [Trichogramma kaykai]